MGSPQASLSLPTASWPTLPTFPHPASLFAGPGNPFVVGEASSATAALDKVKDDLRSGVYDLSLAPPTASSLTPLPPIPVPPASSTRKRSSIAIADGAAKPIAKPSLPNSLKREVSLEKALEEWNGRIAPLPSSTTSSADVTGVDAAASTASVAASAKKPEEERITTTLNSRRDAVLFELGPHRSSGAIWVLLKTMRDDGTHEDGSDVRGVHIAQIKLFSPSDCTNGAPLIHTESRDPTYRAWSHHLSSLSLTLPDLLYRIPHIPAMMASPCFYCNKRLVPQDGLPSISGFLPYAGKRARKSKRAEKKGLGLDGANGAKEEPKDAEAEKEQEKEEDEEKGRWVCWHASCEP